MIAVGFTLAALLILALLWAMFAKAPLGWQDDDGFHLGEPDE